LRNTEKEQMCHDTDEIKTVGNEALIPTGGLRDLLNRLDITTPLEFRIKRVSCPGREEYKAIMEIFSRPNVLSCRKGPAFRATYQDAAADATLQAITTYNHKYHDELKNTVYHLLPQRKKNKFKTSGVKADVPRMLMVHHQDVYVEMSNHLQVAQWDIQSLRDQLKDSNAIIRGYQRMVASEASDLYACDTYTWSATSSGLGAKDEPVVNFHSPLQLSYSLEVNPESVISCVARTICYDGCLDDLCLCLPSVSCRLLMHLVYSRTLFI
jgi:hypothetical protein